MRVCKSQRIDIHLLPYAIVRDLAVEPLPEFTLYRTSEMKSGVSKPGGDGVDLKMELHVAPAFYNVCVWKHDGSHEVEVIACLTRPWLTSC
jgi:hypothetical protein